MPTKDTSIEQFGEQYDEASARDVLAFISDNKDNEKFLLDVLKYEKDNKKRVSIISQCENNLKLIEDALDTPGNPEKDRVPGDASDAVGAPYPDTPDTESKPKPEPTLPPGTFGAPVSPLVSKPRDEHIVTIRVFNDIAHFPEIGDWRWIDNHREMPRQNKTYKVPFFVGAHFQDINLASVISE